MDEGKVYFILALFVVESSAIITPDTMDQDGSHSQPEPSSVGAEPSTEAGTPSEEQAAAMELTDQPEENCMENSITNSGRDNSMQSSLYPTYWIHLQVWRLLAQNKVWPLALH